MQYLTNIFLSRIEPSFSKPRVLRGQLFLGNKLFCDSESYCKNILFTLDVGTNKSDILLYRQYISRYQLAFFYRLEMNRLLRACPSTQINDLQLKKKTRLTSSLDNQRHSIWQTMLRTFQRIYEVYAKHKLFLAFSFYLRTIIELNFLKWKLVVTFETSKT